MGALLRSLEEPGTLDALHRAGVAHSLEVWAGTRLVGGLYGVLTGRVFSGESMFHCEPDASKAAVVDLCQRLVEVRVAVIDTEQESEHLERLGKILAAREDYVGFVRRLRDQVVELPRDRRPEDRLVRSSSQRGPVPKPRARGDEPGSAFS